MNNYDFIYYIYNYYFIYYAYLQSKIKIVIKIKKCFIQNVTSYEKYLF